MLKRLLFAVLLLCACAAQAAVYSLPWGPKPQFIDSNGAPMSGGSISTFQAGSSTPQVTYTTQVGNVANATTITLNVRGETPNEVWLTGGLTYKLVLKDSAGATVWTVDNVSGVNDPSATVQDEWKASGLVPTYVSATSFTFSGDQTIAFHAGRRIKTTNSGGTIYSTIQSATFAPNTTTVTVVNDTGILDAGLSAVSYALLSYNNRSIPSFIASGTSAVVRPIIGCTLNGKLCDTVSVKDFGAKCDNVTDDAAAFQAAINSIGPGGTVVVPGAGTCVLNSQLLLGASSSTKAHALVGYGHPTLKFNIAGHATDALVMQGWSEAPAVLGRQFYPITLSGFDIDCQNTGRDCVVLKESDHPVITDVAVKNSYRNAIALTPTANAWIENPFMRNVLATKCGHHCMYFGLVNNTYINDGTYINFECRGVAINSVTLGINAGTQPNQLGTCIYVLNIGTVNGEADGHTWVGFTADSASSFAVANGSQPNPNVVVWGDGRLAHVIEGAANATASRNYTQWRFLAPRAEDTATGGFTSGSVFFRESANVTTPNLWIDALSGGNWGGMTYSPSANDDGIYLGTSDYPGAIHRIRWGGSIDFNGTLAANGTNVVALTATGVSSRAQIQKVQGASFGNIVNGANADITALGGNGAGIAVIQGTDGAGNDFASVVMFRWFGGAPTVIANANTAGAPPARTYTINGATGELNLAIAAGVGTFAIRTTFIMPQG